MGKGWGSSVAGVGHTGRSCRSTAPDPYGWQPASKPNAACRVPSFACEPRLTVEMVAAVEVEVVHLRLAVVPTLACSTSQ